MSNVDKLALAEYTIQVLGKRLNNVEIQLEQLGGLVINWMGTNKRFLDGAIRIDAPVEVKQDETKKEDTKVSSIDTSTPEGTNPVTGNPGEEIPVDNRG